MMICFLVAILFLCIYGVLFAVLTDPLYRHVSLASQAATTAVHALIVSLAGTAVCCLAFLLPDKRVVPFSFIGLTVLFGMFCAAASFLDAGSRGTMLRLIAMYGLGPVVVGNAVSWPIYLNRFKTRKVGRSVSRGSSAGRAAVPKVPPAPISEESLFGPDPNGPDGDAPLPPGVRSVQEEAALFYEEGDQ